MLKGRLSFWLLPALAVILAACGTAGNVLSVQVSGEQLRLVAGQSTTLAADVKVTGPASDEVTWSSSDDAIATVNDSGVVLAKGPGSATISAVSVANESKSDSVSIAVLEAPAVSPITPGEASAEVDGAAVTVTTDFDGETVALGVAGTELVVGLEDMNGDTLPIRSGGVPRVTADGSVTLAGSGYAPSTAVDVWFFSEPVLLGSVVADSNGVFSASFGLPAGASVGGHTLVIEGTQASGGSLSLRLGLEVEAGAAVVEFAHCPVATDWFVSARNGDDDAIGSLVSAPFASIQVAVDAAEELDVVCVAPGTYAVDNSGEGEGGASVTLVSLNKPLTLVGPNVGIAGAGARGDEAVLSVSSSEDDWQRVVSVSANDVTVDGFYITTSIPKESPVFYLDGVFGVYISAAATEGVTVRNNHLVNANFPIWANRGRAESAAGFLIENNLLEGPEAAIEQGILVQNAVADILNNVIRDARVGVQVQPYHQEGSGTVAGNDLEVFQVGLWFNYAQVEAADWVFSDNTVLGIKSPWAWPLGGTDPTLWSGIRVEQFQDGVVTFTGNEVDAGTADPQDGAYLVRQKNVGDAGVVTGIGTYTELGAFFTSNSFGGYGGGVTTGDLILENELIQLVLPTP